ncbi:MAG: sulfate adenylyltransferase [Helicobacteraceae bacterium]|nr:sulfate adenylyltransferase [Helicobacteraceae bacterium]
MSNNRTLYIDKEAISALSLVKAGLLNPVQTIMNKSQTLDIIKNRTINDQLFPFPFILAPKGKRNEKILTSTTKGEVLDLICEKEKVGELIVEETFEINPKERLRQIYGSDDMAHPGVASTNARLGKYSIAGEYTIDTTELESSKRKIKEAKKRIHAKHTTAIMMASNPLHRAHERLIRQTLEKTDLVVIFLLKPYNNSGVEYSLRHTLLKYFIDNYLPKNRVIIVPLVNSYIFAGYNEVIIDAIVAKNYGCDTLTIGQNHAGIGLYYDQNSNKSIIDRLTGIDIDIDIASEYVYCNECTTLVSTQTCPHGQHHHISYNSDSILELLKLGLLPPAVLMRKELSAMILSSFFPDRFKNLEKLYYDILPATGLLEEHSEKDFYIELMHLYQTTSLT